MPDLLLGQNPRRRAAYIMIVLALIVVALGSWNVTLSRRVSEQEAIRRSEAQGRLDRQRLGCQILRTIVDVSIDIPLQNVHDVLAANGLTPGDRAQREAAERRYEDARDLLKPALDACKPPPGR